MARSPASARIRRDIAEPAATPGAVAMSVTLQRAGRACRLVEWKPWSQPNNSLLGHCAVAFAGGWVVHAIPVFRRVDGSLSVGAPNAAQLDTDGRIKHQRQNPHQRA